MPLNPNALASMLEAHFSDPPVVLVAGVYDATLSRQQCAQAWADAVQAWAVGIVPPSTTVTAACATLSTSLASAFATTPTSASLVDAAFAAFAVTVGGGMAGYAPVPPVAPVNFAALFAQVPPDQGVAAAGVATQVDAWMRTGVSTLIAPPNTPVPWS